MASLRPCDSVSECGGGSVASGTVRSGIEPPVGVADLCASAVSMTSEQLQFASKCVDRYYDSYSLYCTVSSATSAPVVASCAGVGRGGSAVATAASVASAGSGTLSGASAARLRSARRAAAWRARKVVPKKYPAGLCYARVFKEEARQSVASALMDWPTFSAVMSQPSDIVASAVMYDDLRLVRVSGGYHLVGASEVATGAVSWSLYVAMVGLARRSEFPHGTLGSDMRRASVSGADSATLALLSLGDKLGGSDLLFRSQRVPAEVYDHGNCTCVSYPASLPGRGSRTVYLVGDEADDGTVGWRADVLNHLASVDCVALSSKPAASGAGVRGSSQRVSDRRASWERRAMDMSEFVFVSFLAGVSSPYALCELGVALGKGKLVLVECPDACPEAAYVRALCGARGVACFSSFDSAVGELLRLLRARVDLDPVAREMEGVSLSAGRSGPLVNMVDAPVPFPDWVPGEVVSRGGYPPDRSALTTTLALDCEMVTADAHKNGTKNVLGRVSLVNECGSVVYDTFVYHEDLNVVNTNYVWGSGIQWADIRPRNGAREYGKAVRDFRKLVKGKLVVGFDINNDLRSLGLLGEKLDFSVLDVQAKVSTVEGNKPGLKRMTKKYLGVDVQADKGGHSSVEDAVATMALHRAFPVVLRTRVDSSCSALEFDA